MESILSVIATVISSVALIGVAAGLILQNRQLRANQIQVMREMHLELMKIGMDNPVLAAAVYEDTNASDFPKTSLLNFIIKFWETGYTLSTMSKESVALQASRLFASEYARTYWAAGMRHAYQAESRTRSQKEFFSIVDNAFRDVVQSLQTPGPPDVNASNREG